MEEQDRSVEPARAARAARAGDRARSTSTTDEGRDRLRRAAGRVAHESLFNVANGTYRGPSTQQGYSPFTTWTRGLAWAMLGFAEQLEFLETVPDEACASCGGRPAIDAMHARGGARDLRSLHRCRRRRRRALLGRRRAGAGGARRAGATVRPIRSTTHEPVDSSAAAIAAQGLLRLGARPRAARIDGRRGSLPARLDSACSTRCSTSPYLSVDADASGPAAALGLSLAERLGLRAAGRHDAARRVEPVGRLPRARGGAVREAPGRGRAVPHVLRTAVIERRRVDALSEREGCSRATGHDALTHGARHRRHARHRPRHRARARGDGWSLVLCGVRPAAEVGGVVSTSCRSAAATSTTCAADLSDRTDRASSRRRGARAFRRRPRAGQQRRPRAARAGRPARGERRELRRDACARTCRARIS